MEQVRARVPQLGLEPVQLRQGLVPLVAARTLRQVLAQEPVQLASARALLPVQELAQALR